MQILGIITQRKFFPQGATPTNDGRTRLALFLLLFLYPLLVECIFIPVTRRVLNASNFDFYTRYS